MKEDQMATNDELERNLREMRRRIEELRGELQESQNKAEDIERKLKVSTIIKM
jgi:TolA-binding protein